MKNLFHKISSVWSSLMQLIGLGTKQQPASTADAIMFPHLSNHEMVEDYELAAYHNQA
jgi:hypothetical protein